MLARAFVIWRRGGSTMIEAVREAADGAATGEYALIEMRRLLLHINLAEWESHPTRLRAEVHSVFRRSIGRLTPHRGGWRVRSAAH